MNHRAFRAVLRRVALGFLLGGIALFASAQSATTPRDDAITYRSWLDDPDGSFGAKDVLAGEWTPFSGRFSRGFSASTTWVRLKIDPAAAGQGAVPGDHRLVLQWRPVHLDEVAVYRLDRPGQPPVLRGDRQALDPQDRSSVENVVFDEATAPFEVLLRIRSSSNISIEPQALRWDAAREFEARQFNLAIAYLTFSAMVIVWALTLWVEQRDPLTVLVIVHQVSTALVASSLLGVLRQIQLSRYGVALPDAVGSAAVPLFLGTTLLFHARILGQFGARRFDVKLLEGGVALAFAALVMLALGMQRAGLATAQSLVPFVDVLTLFVVCRLRPQSSGSATAGIVSGKTVLIVIYLLLTLMILPQSLRVLGVLRAGNEPFSVYLVHGLVSSLMFGVMLLIRMHRARERSRQEALSLLQTQQEAAEQRARAAEQSELVAMLAHELKTPLSVVNLALTMEQPHEELSKRARKAVGNMRNVIDRCGDAARIDDALSRKDPAPTLQRVALDDILRDVIAGELESDRVTFLSPPDLPLCPGDAPMLRLICANLIENALKYSPVASAVRVTLAPQTSGDRPGVVLRVSNAVGVAGTPDAAQVFDKFYRSANARHSSGSGLGLYLSQRMATRMGGELSVDLDDPGTVTFRFWMSAAPEGLT